VENDATFTCTVMLPIFWSMFLREWPSELPQNQLLVLTSRAVLFCFKLLSSV
jgi:hypothetical protein